MTPSPEPVVLWHRTEPRHVRPWSDHKCDHGGVEYRALPAADFDALLARDAERKGVIDAALCQRIETLRAERDALLNDRDDARSALNVARESVARLLERAERAEGLLAEARRAHTLTGDERAALHSRIDAALKVSP